MPVRSIRSLSRSVSRSAFSRSVTPYEAEDVPFVLDTDPEGTAPDGMTALKGKVQVEGEDGNIVIILTGVLDDTSGEFVAAGVDSEDLGLGFQIEGIFKNNNVSNVKITVKTKEMEETVDLGEWVEEEFDYWDTDVEITAIETVEQEPGLPAAWTGKYKFNLTADSWANSLDEFYANRYPYSGTGTDDITLGEVAGAILEGNDNVFVLLAPMAWSVVINFEAMANEFRTALTTNGFANVNEAMTILKNRLGQFEKMYYCSFLEVESGNGGVYALAFNKWVSLDPDDDEDTKGEYFTKYKISKDDMLILAEASDLIYLDPSWEEDDGIPGHAYTAEAARAGSNFEGGTQWVFVQD
jgi:hypothetical protein